MGERIAVAFVVDGDEERDPGPAVAQRRCLEPAGDRCDLARQVDRPRVGEDAVTLLQDDAAELVLADQGLGVGQRRVATAVDRDEEHLADARLGRQRVEDRADRIRLGVTTGRGGAAEGRERCRDRGDRAARHWRMAGIAAAPRGKPAGRCRARNPEGATGSRLHGGILPRRPVP